jgi:hypothetical protein
MQIPADVQQQVKLALRQLPPAVERWLEGERQRTLTQLADEMNETSLRRLQGKANTLKELLNEIRAAQA